MIKRISICAALIVILLGFVELTARVILKLNKDNKQQLINWESFHKPTENIANLDMYKRYNWINDFQNDKPLESNSSDMCTGLKYEPFYLWKSSPCMTKYRTTDADGNRTTKYNVTTCDNKTTIYVFGSSTMAGDGILRDVDLIPSIIAKNLNEKYSSNQCFEVKNFAQSGFNQGNEYVLFMDILSKGEIPDYVIFYDGATDILQNVLYGEPHMGFEMFNLISTWWSSGDYNRFVTYLALKKSAFFRLLNKEYTLKKYYIHDKDTINKRCATLANTYAGRADVINKLSKQYNFKFTLALQPLLFTVSNLSSEDAMLLNKIEKEFPYMIDTYNTCYKAVRDRLNEKNDYFFDLSNFDVHNESVYFDFAHVSPLGNEMFAKALIDEIQKKLEVK